MDILKLGGRWKFTARHIKTGKVIIKEGHNLIMTVGKALIGDMLIDEPDYDTGLTYCALGSDNTAPALGQTQLVNEGGGEAMRNEITQKSQSDNIITLNTFFAASECVLDIEEIGIFGHSTATGERNSGIMFSRWLVPFDNSLGAYDITIDYELTIGG